MRPYLVIKTIKGNRYYYWQHTWRERRKVKTWNEYVGPVNKVARPVQWVPKGQTTMVFNATTKEDEDSMYITTAKAAGWTLDPIINKWRHSQSSALYTNTPRWGRYACEDHDLKEAQNKLDSAEKFRRDINLHKGVYFCTRCEAQVHNVDWEGKCKSCAS